MVLRLGIEERIPVDKKYQVFVSSTFSDLIEERQEVMQALLELDCIPVGMELFPAADDDQWTLIKGLIDDCDYYILILAGRYGSTGPDGTSYTQMEYEYALERGIPIISFVHADPSRIESGKSEKDPNALRQLDEFRSLVRQKMCRSWSTPSDLGSQVSRSLIKLIKSRPRTGWIRADIATSEEANREIVQLRRRVSELERQLEKARTTAPEESRGLQQGEDEFVLHYRYCYITGKHDAELDINWNRLFFILAPLMVDESTEPELRNEMLKYLKDMIRDATIDEEPYNVDMNDVDFPTIKVQLIALGLISKSDKKRSLNDTYTYWTLTPYGETTMMQLRALRK
jgi:uncharacterized protein DUF4062/A-type inclusion protein